MFKVAEAEAKFETTGAMALSDEEVLAVAVGNASARKLVKAAGSLPELTRWTRLEIEAVVGEYASYRVAAMLEVARRSMAPRANRELAASAPDVWRLMRPKMRDLRVEEFHVLLLDVKMRVQFMTMVTRGSVGASIIHPRDAFAEAIRRQAHAVIFVHNHPSNDSEPSEEDVAATRRLVAAGDLLGIRALDHVIVCADNYYSFADAGRLR